MNRRSFLILAAAGLALPGRGWAAEAVIHMTGSPDGSDVWFDPVGLWVPPGTMVRWVNGDQATSHTTTAYPARIPAGAEAWDSGYLLPGQSFAVTLTVEGVYDYFCRPHEQAGMVGRIVVGRPTAPPQGPAALPSVDEIMRKREVPRKHGGS